MTAIDNRGASSLHVASRYGKIDIVQLFLENAMDADGPDGNGSTPPHQASIYGHLGAVQQLINSGANIMASDNQKVSLLVHEASRHGKGDIIRLLLQYRADVNARDGEGPTPLHRASTYGHLHVIHTLLDFGAIIPTFILIFWTSRSLYFNYTRIWYSQSNNFCIFRYYGVQRV